MLKLKILLAAACVAFVLPATAQDAGVAAAAAALLGGAGPAGNQSMGVSPPGLSGLGGALGGTGARAPVIVSSDAATAGEAASDAARMPLVRQEPITNEFQTFIRQNTGRELPIYGYALFRDAPGTFAPVESVPVTADYVVGPGDEIVIKAWGAVDIDVRAIVDRRGEINIPKVGTFSVAGVRNQDLPGVIQSRIGRVFRGFDLSVGLGKLHAIKIFVTGQAQRPGAYDVSAQSTVVSALFATGGPSVRGTMRNVELKRDGKVVTTFDFYDLLLKGDKTKDVRLQHGDILHIPPVGGFAAVAGSVQQPAIYETRPGMKLQDLIDLAGGLTTTAQTRKATLESIEDRSTRTVDEFALDAASLARPIRDGDFVSVFAISPRFENAVTLRGNVAYPARYPWREGLRIRDLIPEREALIAPDYWTRRNLAVLAEPDSQGTFRNEIKRALAEPYWDYAVVERLNSDLTTTLIPFDLGKVVLQGDDAQNLLLRPGDVLTVFSQDDMSIPRDRRTKFVRLEGEFMAAGVYRIEPGETLRNLVKRVGGLSQQAYLFGAEFSREDVRKLQQKQLTEAADRLEAALQRAEGAQTAGLTRSEDVQAFQRQIAAQRALVARLRNAQANGRIVLEVDENASIDTLPDLPLEDGDRFYVPPRPATVSVFGSVYNQSTFIYRDSKDATDYLAQAGGATRDGDEGGAFVLKADGSVIGARNGWLFSSLNRQKMMPGDAIIVPERLERFNLTRELKDWSQIIYQFALGAAGLKVLRD